MRMCEASQGTIETLLPNPDSGGNISVSKYIHTTQVLQ